MAQSSSNLMGNNLLFPLRFKAPIERSHPLVRPDQYPNAPAIGGATQTCAALDDPEGQGAQYHVTILMIAYPR